MRLLFAVLGNIILVLVQSSRKGVYSTDLTRVGIRDGRRILFELVIPKRINQNGTLYQGRRNFFKYGNSEGTNRTIFYKLVAFRRIFEFHLEQDRSLLAPEFVVEHVFNHTHRIPFAGDLDRCVYRGKVSEDPVSTAIFSLCHGLRGTFYTDGKQYFVEPVDQPQKNSGSDFRKFHIIYRYSPVLDTQDINTTTSTFCAVKDPNDTKVQWPIEKDQVLEEKVVERQRRRRKKRSLDEVTVEVMLTADKTMVKSFRSKAELQSYLITVMGVVSQIYSHASIGFRMNIVLVKIIMLDRDEPGLNIQSTASKTLKSFCKWQQRYNRPNGDPDHFDTAILLTKQDICRGENECDTLGLAELGTVCSPKRSCSIVEDNGLTSAFTLAHELAHVFGVQHDGLPQSRCKRTYGIMGPTISFEMKPWTWSPCSRRAFQRFFDLGYGRCLQNKPNPRYQTRYYNKLPGELYSAAQQCKFVHNQQARVCGWLEPCRRLWCATQHGKQRGCETQHMPWADGTPCETGRWCIKGFCVKKEKIVPVDGNWGQWGPWTPCTRSCGGGINFAYRKCNNPPPRDGGAYCLGKRKKFQSCRTQDCPRGSPEFRLTQCQKHSNRVTINGVRTRVRLVPKYFKESKNPKKVCQLYCHAYGTSAYYKLSSKVADGTKCSEETSNICVDGQCIPAGCDNVLFSKKKLDVCKVCGGDGTSCRKTTKWFRGKTSYGYNYVITIPLGATEVEIIQYGRSNDDVNFLALVQATKQQRRYQGRKSKPYLLNGKFRVQTGQRLFKAVGTTIWYSGADKKTEIIKIPGKTTEEIEVQVLATGSLLPPNIKYSYYTPVLGPQKFKWNRFGEWKKCSSLCNGVRRRKVRCFRVSDGQHVHNRRCNARPKPPPIREQCNRGCLLRWKVIRLSSCSVRCGDGIQRRTFQCMRLMGSSQEFPVDDKHCSRSKRPPSEIRCRVKCESRWDYGDWSSCTTISNKCVRVRNFKCIQGQTRVSDRYCSSLSKPTVQKHSCHPRDCSTEVFVESRVAKWVAGSWGDCSSECGEGQQRRTVRCVEINNKVALDYKCSRLPKPPSTRKCNGINCPVWITGGWSSCSVTCGNGLQVRSVHCKETRTKRVIRESACRGHGRKPEQRKRCFTKRCTRWLNGSWSACSAKCGHGQQSRRVQCVEVGTNAVVNERECASNGGKPPNKQKCMVRKCTQWKTGVWSACSRTCDQGVRRRSVQCIEVGRKTVLSDSECLTRKPSSQKECNLRKCVRWQTAAWSPCSVTCGEGVRQRRVQCLELRSNAVLSDSECAQSNKPRISQRCLNKMCTKWISGTWTTCSKSCGKGVRQRTVSCVEARSNRAVRDSDCTNNKPARQQQCLLRRCTTWNGGAWSACSVTCGEGVKQRRIHCIDTDTRRIVRDNECTGPRLQTTMRCSQRECTSWKTGPWGACSATCGDGVRTRRVHCMVHNSNKRVRDSQCVGSKPEVTQRCSYRKCTTWRSGPWSSCSVTCGEGRKQRSVRCVESNSNKAVHNNRCRTTMPHSVRKCTERRCTKWRAGVWSVCSVTCGQGTKRRAVYCADNDNNQRVHDNECRGTKPTSTDRCSDRRCRRWRSKPWTACSVTCGEGMARRTIQCLEDDTNAVLDDVNCSDMKRPVDTRRCRHPNKCGGWNTSSWGPCSRTCGWGVKRRSVGCVEGTTGAVLSHTHCRTQKKPETVQRCLLKKCTKWRKGPWGSCSVTCGEGEITRRVECVESTTNVVVRDEECAVHKKPETNRICQASKRCTGWRIGIWSSCSASCGRGFRQRSVQCVETETNSILSDDKCHENKPHNKLECVTNKKCTRWRVDEWSSCSATCGEGLQQRTLRCFEDGTNRMLAGKSCDQTNKPHVIQKCNNKKCPVWVHEQWHQCSVSCGEGIQRRTIKCVDVESKQQMPDEQCNTNDKLPSTQKCIRKSCTMWRLGKWEACSVTCGKGVRRRSAKCIIKETNIEVGSEECGHIQKPETSRNCSRKQCTRWSVGEWGPCSVSCGQGWQLRRVVCSDDKSNRALPSRRCAASSRPSSWQRCSLRSCTIWKVHSWEPCSVSCGEGRQSRRVECVMKGTHRRLPENRCSNSVKPNTIRKCLRKNCSDWKIEKWSKCSVTCGAGGVQRRSVHCFEPATLKPLPDSACGGHVSKPQTFRQCPVKRCTSWRFAAWGECSQKCGPGHQSRLVKCTYDNWQITDDGDCDSKLKPPERQSCQIKPCSDDQNVISAITDPNIASRWVIKDWQKCSKTCGEGIKTREVSCYQNEVEQSSEQCDEKSKPATAISCNLGDCPNWVSSEWSTCSKSCGGGLRYRQVECRSTSAGSSCDNDSKPMTAERCSLQGCPEWKVSPWRQCSKTCGNATKTREVVCATDSGQTLEDSSCNKSSKPRETMLCDLPYCGKWKSGPWSRCSKTCGNGLITRQVTCVGEKGKLVSERACNESLRPSQKQSCRMRPCVRWKAGPWTKCSVSCGTGIQRRTVMCFSEKANQRRDNQMCANMVKPQERAICRGRPCPSPSRFEWSTGAWTKCSKTCGSGIKLRLVACVSTLMGYRVDHRLCHKHKKPRQKRHCRTKHCSHTPNWHKGSWSKCSTQCGKGTKRRQVLCKSAGGEVVDERFCRHTKKPRIQRDCHKRRQCGVWEIGSWGKCSVTCGGGVQRRAIRCRHEWQYVQDSRCDRDTRPAEEIGCNPRPCPSTDNLYRWKAEPWNKCSRTCGYGRKTRKVKCVDRFENAARHDYCNEDAKPVEFFPCFDIRCPPKWQVGDWSECSKSCNRGYQVRPVRCEGFHSNQISLGGCNLRKKPPVWRICNYGLCEAQYQWRVGPWSKCSVSCGKGIIRRIVKCMAKDGTMHDESNCQRPAIKPDETRPCHLRPCMPKTCKQVQRTNGLQVDGEFYLLVKGKHLRVFCYGMTTENPIEYITLKSGSSDNFAEIYPKRLVNSRSCPNNGSHTDDCNCYRDEYDKAGSSYFSKIRIDITSAKIITNDLRFAVTRGPNPPPYGTAGDCYSSAQCPQGRFSINLDGTGLEVSPTVKWRSTGDATTQVIHSEKGTGKVVGMCGGRCGTCSPAGEDRLRLIVKGFR